MSSRTSKRIRRFLLLGTGGLLVICILAMVCSALVNAVQPDSSATVDRLSKASQAHIAEITHLRRTLGDHVWPGWGQANIPVLLFNERFAFLTGVSNPADGWKLPLKEITSGGTWERVPEEAYYRQPVQNADDVIGNFTVQVGSNWAIAMETQEWSRIAFRQGFHDDLPPLVREVFPYGLAYGQLFGRSDVYLGGLAHEAFHTFQAETAPERLVASERAAALLDRYPWDSDKIASAWRDELSLLRQALQASSDLETARLAKQFLTTREQRRQFNDLSADLVNLERQREWLEGLAKYAELSLGRAAAVTPGYASLPDMKTDAGFHGWSGYRTFYEQQVNQIDKMASPGESWLYYSGMAQAALLDRLMPGWKAEAFKPDIFLEDLLKEAVGKIV